MTDLPYDRSEPRTALFHRYLERRAAVTPDKFAYTYEPIGVESANAETGTWEELNAAAGRAAEELDDAGVGEGDFVVTLLPQSPQYLATYAAVAKLGAVLVPLDFRSESREISDVMERTEPTAFLGFDRYRGDGYRDIMEDIDAFNDVPNVWWLDEDDVTAVDAEGSAEEAYEWSVVASDGTDLQDNEATGHLNPDAPLLVVFTSGTTGRPKGALLSHRSVVFQGTAIADSWEVDESDTSLVHLPPSHVGGSTEQLATALVSGSSMVFLDAIEPGRALEKIDENDVTLVGNVPALWEMFFAFSDYRENLSSVRIAIVAGQAASETTIEKMSEIGTATTGWGLTETGGFVTLTELDDGVDVLNETVGRPYPGFDVHAVDGEGEPLDRGEVGELAVRGDGVMVGYMDTESEASSDGWIRTGDMGFVGDDGRVRLRGRAHEMYISGGYNVYPAEVEDVLTDHPDVRLALVVGVEDERWGETGHAFIVPEVDTDIGVEQLERHCEERLADYKRPSDYTVESSLPKTVLGKIDRQRIIDEYGLETV